MRVKYTSALALLVLLVQGCATLGVPAPKTFNEKVLVAITAVTTVRDTSTALLTAHKISVADKENIEKQADNVREAIEVARQIDAANPGAGAPKIDAAIAILNVLQTYLISKQRS